MPRTNILQLISKCIFSSTVQKRIYPWIFTDNVISHFFPVSTGWISLKKTRNLFSKMQLRMEEMYPNHFFFSFGHSSPSRSPVRSIAVTHSKPGIIFPKTGSTSHNILNIIALFSHSACVQTNSGGLAGLNSFSKWGTMDILIVLWFWF